MQINADYLLIATFEMHLIAFETTYRSWTLTYAACLSSAKCSAGTLLIDLSPLHPLTDELLGLANQHLCTNTPPSQTRGLSTLGTFVM